MPPRTPLSPSTQTGSTLASTTSKSVRPSSVFLPADPSQEHSAPNTTPAQLIKLVEAQLLLSDLSTSTHPPRALLPTPLPDAPSTLYPGRANATLFQILRINEVGHAALGLLDTLKEKREGRALRERQEREGWQRKDGEEERVEGVWPRGMVRVLLSDGHGECEGIEYTRVEGMSWEEVRLGCKVRFFLVREGGRR